MYPFKIIKKSSLSFFFISLILLTSCNQYDNEFNPEYNLTNYVEKHINLSFELFDILKKEENINLKELEVSLKNKSKEEVHQILKKANFIHHEIIMDLLEKIENNSFLFAKNNQYLNKYKVVDIESLIQQEIIRQLAIFKNNSNMDYKLQKGPCEDAYNTSGDNCNENFAISAAAVGVSGFFSLGIGTLVGGMAAFMLYVKCTSDANHAYYDCLDTQS